MRSVSKEVWLLRATTSIDLYRQLSRLRSVVFRKTWALVGRLLNLLISLFGSKNRIREGVRADGSLIEISATSRVLLATGAAAKTGAMIEVADKTEEGKVVGSEGPRIPLLQLK